LAQKKNIEHLKREDLVEYINTYYTGPRVVLAGAGGVDHNQLVELANTHFSKLPNSNKGPKFSSSDFPFTGSMITVRNDSMQQLHFVLAAPAVGYSHPDFFTFSVIQTIIGSWDRTTGGGKNLSSRLCEQFATENLGYSLNTFHTAFQNTGIFGNYCVVPDSDIKIEDSVHAVLSEWVRIGYNVTASEVERAKQKLKASMLLDLDGTTPICEDIGRQLLTIGRRLTPAEVFLRIDAIQPADVMRVAQDYLTDLDPAISVFGPSWEFPDYGLLRQWTVWRRL